MKGPKIFAAALVGGALIAGGGPASAAVPAYKHYVACGTAPTSKPSHSCPAGSKKGAYFKSTKADVKYSICVDFPRGRSICAKAQDAKQGTLYVNRITSNIPGQHKVSWFVAGKRVGVFYFKVT